MLKEYEVSDRHTVSDVQQWLHDRIVDRLAIQDDIDPEALARALASTVSEARARGHLIPSADIERVMEHVEVRT